MTDPFILSVAAAGLILVGGSAAIVGLRQRPDGPDEAGEATGSTVQHSVVDPRMERALPLRMLDPLGHWLARRLSGLLPANHLQNTRRKLTRAGVATVLSAEEFLALRAIGLLAGIGMLILVVAGPTADGGQQLAAAALALVLGLFAPPVLLAGRRERYVKEIQRQLPDALDLLAISVEAGVGLESALQIVTANVESGLGYELDHTLREMKLGLTRRESLHNLRDRVDVPELSSFIGSLLQADALGMPLSRVLRSQAEEMRTKRQQAAREAASKLPVKMLIPMLFFIMPAIFVVTIGPAALQMLGLFMR